MSCLKKLCSTNADNNDQDHDERKMVKILIVSIRAAELVEQRDFQGCLKKFGGNSCMNQLDFILDNV